MNGIVVLTVALVGLSIAAGATVVIYNRLVRGRLLVQEGFSGIDVQLKRRHSLIPNLVTTVEGYADFEKSVLADVTQRRVQAMGDESVADKQRDENALSDALKTLFAVAEAYPDLKANNSFLSLQQELSAVEDVIQKARRYYNGTVREYNTSVESFPGNLVAGMFRFQPAGFFELESLDERKPPQVEMNRGQKE
jgi:LemA protein